MLWQCTLVYTLLPTSYDNSRIGDGIPFKKNSQNSLTLPGCSSISFLVDGNGDYGKVSDPRPEKRSERKFVVSYDGNVGSLTAAMYGKTA